MHSFRIGEYTFTWNGLHTVNVGDKNKRGLDVFSLNYERDDYTLDEVKAHAVEWIEYMEAANV